MRLEFTTSHLLEQNLVFFTPIKKQLKGLYWWDTEPDLIDHSVLRDDFLEVRRINNNSAERQTFFFVKVAKFSNNISVTNNSLSANHVFFL